MPLDGGLLSRTFEAHWLILRAARTGQYPELKSPPFREVYRDGAAVLYAIKPSP